MIKKSDQKMTKKTQFLMAKSKNHQKLIKKTGQKMSKKTQFLMAKSKNSLKMSKNDQKWVKNMKRG